MSYETKIEEMVGKYVAEFQWELSTAKRLQPHEPKPQLPYGYPVRAYHPMHILRTPHVQQFIARTGGKLSNGVPKILRAELVDDYPLGAYNPAQH